MKATGRGKSGRGGAGCGRGSLRGSESYRTTSQPQVEPIGIIGASLETGQSSNPSVGALQIEQMSTGHLQRISLETLSLRNQQETIRPSLEAETGAGYVREKGYEKKPPRKAQIQQADIETSVSSAMESMRQEMQADINQKLQEEHEDMNQKLQEQREDMDRKLQGEREDMDRKLQEEREQMAADLQKKMKEEREHMKREVDKMLQEQMTAIMTRMQ